MSSVLISVPLKLLMDSPDKKAVKYMTVPENREVWIPRSLIKHSSLVNPELSQYDVWIKKWFCDKESLSGRELPLDEVSNVLYKKDDMAF